MNRSTSQESKSNTLIGVKNITEKEKLDFNLKYRINCYRTAKVCSKCNQRKNVIEFYFKAGRRRLQAECRTCLNNARIKKHSSSPFEYIDYLTKNLRNINPKKRRKKSTISRLDFLKIFRKQIDRFGLKCPYSGITMTWELGSGKPTETNISIDRFDSTRPYEAGNVVFCCWFVNRMKFDYTDQEFIGACEHIARNKERFNEVRNYLKGPAAERELKNKQKPLSLDC